MVRFRKITAITVAGLILSSASYANKTVTYTQQQLAYMPVIMQIELFKAGVLSPVDVLKAQIAQYKKTNEIINASTYTYFSKALSQAKSAEIHYKNGTYRALEGITVALKDEHHDKGMKVTQGSLIHKNDTPMDSADSVTKKLKAAGAIFVMQTTVPELYLNFTTATRAWGVTRNPWNLNYTVGGSSGGSCAALVAGYATLATGSDMGGSIRIPSSMGGLYGYKPAFGEVHTDLPFSVFSGTGPMARTFSGMVLMQNVIAGPGDYSVNVKPHQQLPLRYTSIKGMKIAYVGGMGIIQPSKQVQDAMNKAISILRKQGAIVDKINLDIGLKADEITKYFSNMALSGSMGGVLSTYAKHTDKMTHYGAHFAKKANSGEYNNKAAHAAEVKIKSMYKVMVDVVFKKGYQIMILPTMPTTHIPANYDFTRDKALIIDGKKYPRIVGGLYTIPFNMLNWMPVISVPAGLSNEDIPIGMQIVGKPHQAYQVFRVAYAYSKAARPLYRNDMMPKYLAVKK